MGKSRCECSIGRSGAAWLIRSHADVGYAHPEQGIADERARSGSILLGEYTEMDSFNNAVLGVRRNEDIALDLLKFVAGTAGVGRPVAGSTGFSGAAGAKADEYVTQLLELYVRCLKTIEGKGASQ